MEKIRDMVRRHSLKRGSPEVLSRSGHTGARFYDGNEAGYTTGRFAKLDRNYRRHCGPTAILNLIYTLASVEGIPVKEAPEAVFCHIARIGGRRLIYLNADFMKRFGGTSDFLVPVFIRSALKAYGITGYKVRGPFPATAKRICAELDKGAVLYLEVHGHPVYGSHHMLCYGYDLADGRLMLRVADGWINKIHELPAGEELFAFCTSIVRR
jgi:hypothetical protein